MTWRILSSYTWPDVYWVVTHDLTTRRWHTWHDMRYLNIYLKITIPRFSYFEKLYIFYMSEKHYVKVRIMVRGETLSWYHLSLWDTYYLFNCTYTASKDIAIRSFKSASNMYCKITYFIMLLSSSNHILRATILQYLTEQYVHSIYKITHTNFHSP